MSLEACNTVLYSSPTCFKNGDLPLTSVGGVLRLLVGIRSLSHYSRRLPVTQGTYALLESKGSCCCSRMILSEKLLGKLFKSRLHGWQTLQSLALIAVGMMMFVTKGDYHVLTMERALLFLEVNNIFRCCYGGSFECNQNTGVIRKQKWLQKIACGMP